MGTVKKTVLREELTARGNLLRVLGAKAPGTEMRQIIPLRRGRFPEMFDINR